MLFELGSFLLLFFDDEFDVLAEFDGEDTASLHVNRDRVRCNHTDLWLLRLGSTLGRLLFGFLFLFRRVGILIIRPLVHCFKQEFDFFRLSV